MELRTPAQAGDKASQGSQIAFVRAMKSTSYAWMGAMCGR